MSEVRYVNRTSGEVVTETVLGDGALRFAYETLLGRTLWPVLFGSRVVSAFLGRYYDSPRSKSKIAALANLPGCEPAEAEKPWTEYPSFNTFFTRRLKTGARPLGEGLVSPADGRLLIYPNASLDGAFPLKGARRTLRQVLALGKDESLPFAALDIVVVRLAPVDYHRYHFPTDCTVSGSPRVIRGKYHSVNPIALLRYPDVYADNERQITRCEASWGTFFIIEVGAFGVGTIKQTFECQTPRKGDEKGYFKFGGSTVILALPAGKVTFDADLLAYSKEGLETRVRANERIGLV